MKTRNQVRIGLISVLFLCFVTHLNSQDDKKQPPIFKVQVDTVYVNVSVSDSLNRYVTGLEKENFKVYEDNVEQTILHFSQESAPISLGIVFDISASMGFENNIRIGKQWLASFLESGFLETRNPDDEYSLITFNQKVNLIQAFTDKSSNVQNEIALQKPGGWTALYDAVYRGIDHVKQGRNEKKALILVTDGEENSSRYTWSDIRDMAQESNVQVYAIGYAGPEGYGSRTLGTIIRLTGGRVFFAGLGELGYYFNLIHAELRSQYLLGYSPTNTTRDGKWRKIRVKMDPPKGLPKLFTRAKDGYLAPKY